MTKCIAKSVSIKNKLYRNYLSHLTKAKEMKYKQYKNKLNHVIKIAKKNYYEEQLMKYKNDSKSLWQTLNEIINKHKNHKKFPNMFNGSLPGEKISDPHKIADKFNEYFINVGPGLAKNIPNISNKTFNTYLIGKNKNSFFLKPTTICEIEDTINELNCKKSAGFDGIKAKMIKLIAKEISIPLTHIFNLTFQTGTIPDNLKKALVTPIYKTNDQNEFKNYRPISVLTCFSKILEKLVCKRLMNFIEKHKILTESQFGFRKNRSTELAIMELTEKISRAIDKGEYTIGIFLDLSKAFDTIDHRILVQKLEHYGIRGITQKWFQDYLNNRKQVVKYNQTRSSEMIIKSGVPQGSILGPILFLLYINDIENSSKLLSFILFADDTNIFYSHKCLKSLNEIIQTEINNITDWLNVNKLSLNVSKTKFMLFKSINKRPKQKISISMNDKNIEQVRELTFLGIVMDECLTWNHHIMKISKKLIRASGIIAKVRHFVNRNTIKLIYYALVYPYLTYGNLIWGYTYKTKIDKIMKIQKKIVRLMLFRSYLEHKKELFEELSILDIFKINNYLTAIFMFRYHYLNNLPDTYKLLYY